MAHPLEQLRYVARNWHVGELLPTVDLAGVLAELAEDSPSMLLQACRRMIEYFPGSGAVWWLSARALTAPDPVRAIWESCTELDEDPTGRQLADALPDRARVGLSPPAPVLAYALRRRPDVRAVKKLSGAQVLLLPVAAASPAGLLLGAAQARTVELAGHKGIPIWAVLGRGVVLPEPLWPHLLEMALPTGAFEVAGPTRVTSVVCDEGLVGTDAALASTSCPAAAELLGWRH